MVSFFEKLAYFHTIPWEECNLLFDGVFLRGMVISAFVCMSERDGRVHSKFLKNEVFVLLHVTHVDDGILKKILVLLQN
jgi:hypothetical protein